MALPARVIPAFLVVVDEHEWAGRMFIGRTAEDALRVAKRETKQELHLAEPELANAVSWALPVYDVMKMPAVGCKCSDHLKRGNAHDRA